MRVAILVANLFTRVPVEAAVRAAGAQPVLVTQPEEALAAGCRALLVDLGTGVQVSRLARVIRQGIEVIAFGPHAEGELLSQVRQVGGVALPRGAFLRQLPQLLTALLGSRA